MTNDGKDSADSQCDEFLEVPLYVFRGPLHILREEILRISPLRFLQIFFLKYAKNSRFPSPPSMGEGITETTSNPQATADASTLSTAA